jgi:3-mercaptopyruvate sulfurtransferase SseA
MIYAGVKDVRLMDSGIELWMHHKFPVEREPHKKFKPDTDYGTLMFTRKHD